jgi:hypothetical protein
VVTFCFHSINSGSTQNCQQVRSAIKKHLISTCVSSQTNDSMEIFTKKVQECKLKLKRYGLSPFNQQVVSVKSSVTSQNRVDNSSFDTWNALNRLIENQDHLHMVASRLIHNISFTFTINFGSIDLRLCSSNWSLDLSVPAGYIINLASWMTRTCCKYGVS